MTNPSLVRRQVLAVLGLSATAGCVELIPGRGDSGASLGGVSVANSSESDITIDLLIEQESSRVYHEQLNIPVEDYIWIEPMWLSGPARYDFYCLISGIDEIQHHSTNTTNRDEECVFAILSIYGEDSPIGPTDIQFRDVDEFEDVSCDL